MTKTGIFSVLLLLSSCSCDTTIFRRQYANIERACQEKGGWASINVNGPFQLTTARCVDGTYVDQGVIDK